MLWNGVPLGFTKDDKPRAWSGSAATLVCGPPGSGKTVKLICNQLLDDDSGSRSYFVLDPKAQVCAITSKFRRKVGDVKIINGYGLLVDQRPDMKSDKWNPLAALDPGSPTFTDDCAAIGNALIKTDSNEHQKHFPDAARSAATGCIMQEVKDARRDNNRPPSLLRVRLLLTQDAKPMRDFIRRVIGEGDPAIISRLSKFLDDTDELANIKSTFEVASTWVDSPLQADMETTEGVDFRDGRKRCTTYYIICPTEELESKAVYLRLALSAAVRAIFREPGIPMTLIIEEGFVLGHHAIIEQGLSILRDFGGNMTIAFQSIEQIKQLYPNTFGLFLGGAVCGFRPGDLETARWMSDRSSEKTDAILSAADPSSPTDLGVRPSWQQQKRPRIPVGKLFSMPDNRALVWRPGEEAPTVVRMRAYYEIPRLAARSSPNPYVEKREKHSVGSAATTIAVMLGIAVTLLTLLLGP